MIKKESYLKFWWRSSNEHGVHSPFIFNLLTKGLYPSVSQWEGMSKKDAFIPRIIQYYHPSTTAVLGDLTPQFSTAVPFSEVTEAVDMVYISQLEDYLAVSSKLPSLLHNDTVVVLDRRREDDKIESLWAAIVEDSRFTATVDFYYFGLAFVRSEQLKQHFTLRF